MDVKESLTLVQFCKWAHVCASVTNDILDLLSGGGGLFGFI